MARPLRLAQPDTFYHVLARGNERRPVFREDRDYVRFVEVLADASERFDVEVHAYVLMVNHYHLVVRTRRANLSQAMQWLGVSYAAWFNAKHKRSGHLFQGRFKSFVVEEDEYLDRLIAYVHRNPLRAGLVERLADWPWSSYLCLAYARACPPWLERNAVLSRFGGTPASFRRAVQAYSEEKDRLFENLRHALVLGTAAGVERLRRKINAESHAEKPQTRALAADLTIDDAIARVLDALQLSGDTIDHWRGGVRGRPLPERDLLAYGLWRTGRFTSRQIADALGLSSPAVLYARRRGEESFPHQKGLRARLEKKLKLKM